MKNSLTDIIKNLIKASGKIRIDEYVNICLYHPEYGYYKTSNPIGKKNDFITSPEISQMFGEMIAFWIAHTWHHMKCPKKFNLVEMGAGTGILAEDILNTLEHSTEIYQALTYNIIDVCDPLIEVQKETLSKYTAHNSDKIQWVNEITDLTTDIPIIFISNELLDCLASRKFIFTNKGWGEIYITLNDNDEIDVVTILDNKVEAMIPHTVKGKPMQGDVYEFSPAMINMVDVVANHVNKSKGCGIFIDYGYDTPPLYSTLQSIKKHQHSSVLQNHGLADLTSHVNFKLISEYLKSLKINVESLQSQQTFLINLGILNRAELLAGDGDKNSELFQSVESELDRLISIDKMGALFKVLAFSSKEYANIPAFTTHDPIIDLAHNNCYGMVEPVRHNKINRHKPIQLPPYMKHSTLKPYEHELSHGFFGRNGGVSTDSHVKSLNISYSVKDVEEYVEENRTLIAKAMGFTLEHDKYTPTPPLYITHQVHKDNVKIIHKDTSWTRENTPQADAMVTNVPNVILGISTADCGCVLFYDPIAKIIGASHAGWRGAFANVLENTITEMENLGAKRQQIISCISPCIWQKSYEVDESFYKNLESVHTDSTYLAEPNPDNPGHYFFDLPKFIENKLTILGMKNIGLSQTNTYTDTRFFSHRLDTHNGIYTGGRQLSTIMLKSQK